MGPSIKDIGSLGAVRSPGPVSQADAKFVGPKEVHFSDPSAKGPTWTCVGGWWGCQAQCGHMWTEGRGSKSHLLWMVPEVTIKRLQLPKTIQ